MTAYEQDKMFVLSQKEGAYHVRYTFTPVDDGKTELEYYEWVDTGEVGEPFAMATMEKLKQVLENE